MNLDNENISCTKDEMRKAAEGHLTTEALMWNQNANQTTVSGMSSEDFRLVPVYCLIKELSCMCAHRGKRISLERPHLKTSFRMKIKIYLL